MTMTYEEFILKTMDEVQAKLANCEVELKSVTKNNGVVLKGLKITCPGTNTAPVIYLEEYYDRYDSGEIIYPDVVRKIVETYNQSAGFEFDITTLTDISKVFDKICFRLVNAKLNEEKLTGVPHRKWLDLAVTYYVNIEMNNEGIKTITVKNEYMKIWGVNERKLFEYALKNTPEILPAKVIDITKMLSGIPGVFEENEINLEETNDFIMYALSNKKMLNGATAILYPDELAKLSEKMNANLWLLPSSVHEWFVVPGDEDIDPEEFASLIKDVNSEIVEEEEVLSDHAYFYDRLKKEVYIR